MSNKRQHDPLASSSSSNNNINNNNTKSSYFHLFLLDLPKYISISIDGCVPKILKETDNTTFIGISNIPYDKDDTFHFACIRNIDGHSVNTSSLILIPSDIHKKTSNRCSRHYPHIGRRYDPNIEDLIEMDDLTLTNVLYSLEENNSITTTSRMMIPYSQFVSSSSMETSSSLSSTTPVQRNQWEDLTNYISRSLLDKKGIYHGYKIIPSIYHDDNDEEKKDNNNEEKKKLNNINVNNDGMEVQYPPIPCIDFSNEDDGIGISNIHFTRNKHKGTSKYISTLTPSQRTSLFFNDKDNNNIIIKSILLNNYNNQWNEILGDFQLSFILLIHIGCLHSLEYWRDVICMLSFVDSIENYEYLFQSFLETLVIQFQFMDVDFFQEMDISENNFILPALKRFYHIIYKSNTDDSTTEIRRNWNTLQSLLQNRFHIQLPTLSLSINDPEKFNNEDDNDDDSELSLNDNDNDELFNEWDNNNDNLKSSKNDLILNEIDDNMDCNNDSMLSSTRSSSVLKSCKKEQMIEEDDDYDDDEQPVIISMEEYERSMTRMQQQTQNQYHYSNNVISKEEKKYRASYPFLFAAQQRNCEDILMTCARILDDETDHLLIREATAYLNDVEAKK